MHDKMLCAGYLNGERDACFVSMNRNSKKWCYSTSCISTLHERSEYTRKCVICNVQHLLFLFEGWQRWSTSRSKKLWVSWSSRYVFLAKKSVKTRILFKILSNSARERRKEREREREREKSVLNFMIIFLFISRLIFHYLLMGTFIMRNLANLIRSLLSAQDYWDNECGMRF
jgi:hypothetical protein